VNEITAKLNRLQKVSLITGLICLVLCAVAVVINRSEFFVSYLAAFIFWFGLTLGCLNITMIHALTGGRWGDVTRRFLEAGFMTLPLMALFFAPVLFGLSDLYAWARPAAVAADKILQQKAIYENVTGFILRALLFFGIWICWAVRLRKWSLRQDTSLDATPLLKMRALSGPGIVIVPLVTTFAFVDWIMSIEPAWFSTIFAVILMAGQVLTAFAFIVILLAWLQNCPPFQGNVTTTHFHHLGNFLLTFVMFWTYVSFSQFLIIYSGNQPHEIGWYLRRIAGSWKWLVCFLALFHFFAPFFLLLFRTVKKSSRSLAILAVVIFLVHFIEVLWIIAPTFYPGGVALHWTDFAAWAGIGGIWLAVFAANLKRHPLLIKTLAPVKSAIIQTVHAKPL
jgi:hypothetical protein